MGEFIKFKTLFETQTGKKIKNLQSDNGREYVNIEFDKVLAKYGIARRLTVPYTPEQNGVAERCNRTLMDMARCLLIESGMPPAFWAEAVNTANYIRNCAPTSKLKGSTPYQSRYGKPPNVSIFQRFGIGVYVSDRTPSLGKLQPRAKKGIFIGYSTESKGFRVWLQNERKIVVSRDVKFLKNVSTNIDNALPTNIDDVFPIDEGDNDNKSSGSRTVDIIENPELVIEKSKDDDVDNSIEEPEYEGEVDSNQVLRRSDRILKSKKMNEFVYKIQKANDDSSEPLTIEEAFSREDAQYWREAVKVELQSLEENDTWDIVDLPEGRKPVKCKWVFKQKTDENGVIIRYKARLVAKGCSQKQGIDYNETYSPVIRYSSLRYLIALSVKNKLKINQMDAVTAFLQGDLKEDIYMQMPENVGTKKVCKLKKAIYGLKQSGREWNIKLCSFLKSYGLENSKVDPCIYLNSNKTLVVAIYVDDLLIFWKDENNLNTLKQALCNKFKMKDLGTAKNVVGLNITYESDGIALNQSKYINEILKRFKMEECNPCSTPSDLNQKLTNDMIESNNLVGKVPYQEAVGSLIYVSQGTRPDIAYAVNNVSRFNNNHGEAHWKAVKRIFRYLKGTINYKLHYVRNEDIVGFCDADWAADVIKRRSCTGYVFNFCGGAISWASKHQPTVALSTTEAEYMSLACGTQEAMWLKQLQDDLEAEAKKLVINCDNNSALKLAENDRYRARTKHIDVRHHFIRDKLEEGLLIIKHVPTDGMVADALTKPVPREKQIFCNTGMGLF